jgi:Tol biopolymer transport system component
LTAYFEGKPYLAEGSVESRRIKVLKEGAECPSFSPDGKRIAFKKRTSATGWSPAVMELSTKTERVIDVGDSVDDQIEWLDSNTLVYEVVVTALVGPSTINLMSLDLREPKPQHRLWLKDARSPTIVGRK